MPPDYLRGTPVAGQRVENPPFLLLPRCSHFSESNTVFSVRMPIFAGFRGYSWHAIRIIPHDRVGLSSDADILELSLYLRTSSLAPPLFSGRPCSPHPPGAYNP